MRKVLWIAVAAGLVFVPASGAFALEGQAQQTQQPDQQTSQQTTSPALAPTTAQAPSQQDSLAAAARKTREQKKEAPKAARVFDNDNIPTSGGVSTVGAAPAAPSDAAANGATPAATPNDEKTWRDKFAALNHKLDQDQAELDVLQRELGVSDVQFYADPMKAMQQDLTREDINKKTAAIEAKKTEIAADKQAISDAEEALRKAGGDSGWAR